MIMQGILAAAIMLIMGADVERPRMVRDYMQPRVPYANVAVADAALTLADVERWASYLVASESQVQFMQTQYEEFVRRHNAVIDREAPKLLTASAEISIALEEEGDSSPAHTKRLETLRRQSARLRQQLEQVEHDYINLIEPALTEEQIDRLLTLRNEAVRRQARARPSEVRWVDVELGRIWHEVDQLPFSPDDLDSVNMILQNYEHAMTPLVRRLADTHWNLPVQISKLIVDARSGIISWDEFQVRNDRVRTQYLRSLQSIRTLNENTLRQIVEATADDVANEFVRRAKAAAFPELYPDRSGAHPLFEAIILDDELDESVREFAAVLFNEYTTHYERANRELEEFCADWGEQLAMGRNGYQTQFLPEALEPMLRKRRELSRKWREQLTTVVDPDVVESLPFDDDDERDKGDEG